MGGMYYSDETLKKIKECGDIVGIISQYVPLKKKGSVFMGCCPFHKEKTPSFIVSKESQSYCCQGCGVSGNALTFLRKINDYTFDEALQVLAKKENIILSDPIPFERTPTGRWRKRIFELNRDAAIYFYKTMQNELSGKRGMDYLTERGITKETIRKFGLGYAPYNGTEALKYLRSLGYTKEELQESGIAKLHEEYGLQCVFRNRVIFPIFDSNGRVAGFGGRALWANPKSKYLNSKDTESFNKKMLLYGFQFAKQVPGRSIILCEGFMDVISMHQAGFHNAAASLGTAFTLEQARLVRKYYDKAYLAYDSDGPGIKAAINAIDALRGEGVSSKIIDLKPYQDPDEFMKALGKNAYLERIKDAEDGIRYRERMSSLESIPIFDSDHSIDKKDFKKKELEEKHNFIEEEEEREYE